jgi:LemA protein
VLLYMYMNTLYILLGLVVLVVLWALFTYNRFISLRNRVKEAFSDIDVQLKRRYDLIPNLVETVKGYATQEKEVFTKVTEARAKAMGAQGTHDKAAAENMLSQTLKSLFAVTENYPQLQSSQNFLELQRELRDTEDKIQAARRFHNTTVMALNTGIQTVPANFIANMFGFKQEEFFEVEELAQREAPSVKF